MRKTTPKRSLRIAVALALLTLPLATVLVTERVELRGAVAATGDPSRDDFTLPDPEGRQVSLNKFLGKMPILLVFWATWCPNCNAAVPEINRFHGEYSPAGRLQILALDYKESVEKVNAFIAEKKVSYPVLLDRDGLVARKFRVVGIPTYILIDRKGSVVYRDHDLPEIARYLRGPEGSALPHPSPDSPPM